MPIIENIKDYKTPQESMMNLYPDQFNTQKDKDSTDWVKVNLDYFYTVAINQFTKNVKTFVNNYDLVKGILKKEDFYYEEHVRSFTEALEKDLDLPAYVKHYPIINAPLNTMVGECVKRPDNARVKAFDDDSRSEELEFRTDLLQQYIYQQAKQKIDEKLTQQGVDINSKEGQEQEQQMTLEEIKDYMTSYTSLAERWGSHMLEALKMEFVMKTKSEDAFRDLLISGREFFHICEDKSKTGFRVEVANPKNVWYLTVPDREYTRDAYAAGTIEIMEISEILNTFDLSEQEVIHLREKSQAYLIDVRESNLVNPRAVGIGSVNYDVYDPLVLETRMLAESQLKQNVDELHNFLGVTNNVGVFGHKYVVVRAYWQSKRKVGRLVYKDENGNELVTLVDENYKKIPEQISLEWGWINQWYKGLKIGPDVYYSCPLQIMDYCPIIGVVHEIKNTQPVSLIDLMKPYQMIYNVCLNQIWRLLEKEIGVGYKIQLKRIPTLKDGDDQDALEQWLLQAREQGIMLEDDTPEMASIPNTAVSVPVDLTRSKEIENRYQLAQQIKNECWELVGLTRQRMGSTTSSETATSINTALTQSYAQTEPYFAKHEVILNQVYQAILDVAMWIESNKEESTVSYVSDQGEAAFVKLNGTELKLRDLKVFVSSRAEDQRFFQELRQLAQPMLQNGASPYEIATLYSTNSVRQMKDIFKSLKEKQDQMAQTQQQLEQQKQQSEDQNAQQAQAFEIQKHKDEIDIKRYEIDTKASVDLAKAHIASQTTPTPANPNDKVTNDLKQQELQKKGDIESSKMAAQKDSDALANQMKEKELELKKQDLKVREEEIKGRLEVEKLKARQKKPTK